MPGRTRPRKILTVDWDARTLRVVHAFLGKRGIQIDRMLTVAIPPDLDPADPEQMGRHIRRTLDQEGIGTKHAVVDIPRDQAILKTLTLPTTRPEELPGMVEIQIAKELPFPVSEAAVDFAVAPGVADSATGEVLVAAIRREVLAQYEAIFVAAELKLDRIGLRPYANKAAVDELLKHAMPERVLFIDVRPTFMEIDVLRHSALAFSRSASVTIPTGGGVSPVLSIVGGGIATDKSKADAGAGDAEELPATEDVIPSLMLEVTRSIEAYRAGDPGAVIDHVVIGGDIGVEEALAEAIQNRLNITTEIYNPASTFGWEPDEGAEASAFAASLGLVLGHSDDGTLHFDFLHPKRSVSVAQERLKKTPMVAAVVIVFAAAAGVGLAAMTKPARERLVRLDEAIVKLEGRRKENKALLTILDDVAEFDARQHVWVDVLYDVISLLPSNREIVLNHVEMSQKLGRLTLKTKTKKRETAIEVIRTLEQFRRDGREAARFKVSIGTQIEKKGEKYPFYQDLRITVLDDTGKKKTSSKGPRGG